jgi:hypothetical protein
MVMLLLQHLLYTYYYIYVCIGAVVPKSFKGLTKGRRRDKEKGRGTGAWGRGGVVRESDYIFSSLDPFTTGLAFASAALFIDL